MQSFTFVIIPIHRIWQSAFPRLEFCANNCLLEHEGCHLLLRKVVVVLPNVASRTPVGSITIGLYPSNKVTRRKRCVWNNLQLSVTLWAALSHRNLHSSITNSNLNLLYHSYGFRRVSSVSYHRLSHTPVPRIRTEYTCMEHSVQPITQPTLPRRICLSDRLASIPRRLYLP